MNVATTAPTLLQFLVAAFVVLESAGLVAAWATRSGSAAAGRLAMLAVWVLGSGAVAALGFRQYGFRSVLPAVVAVAVSAGIVYLVTRGGAGRRGWPVAAALVSVAAVVATAMLPVSLLLILAMLGIDGP